MLELNALQSRVHHFMQSIGIQSHAVYVELVEGNTTLAYSKGACLLGIYVGGIFISRDIKQYIPDMTESELDFIVAHELSHILLQHYPTSVVLELPKAVLSDIEAGWAEIAKVGMDFVKLIMLIKGELPPKEKIKKTQEIAADALAVHLICNKKAAISFMKKLAGGNVFRGSHYFRVFDANIPFLFFNERILQIEQLQVSSSV